MDNLARARRSIRFKPESTTLTYAQVHTGAGFTNEVPGILRDESYRGCCAIFQNAKGLEPNVFGLIRVGVLAAIKFRVAWTQPLKDGFVKCGIEYLE